MLFDIAIKLINIKSARSVKQKYNFFLTGGNADIRTPPIKAPKPSKDTIIPVLKGLIENFSITRIPIKERNGKAKILNNGVSRMTVIKVDFFDTSEITSKNNFPNELLSFEN
tara:strand:- start:78 stop:413 length:336 start_codon:yes stop_codon:yes gene_type:complete